jgi:hypothetical protein
MPIENLSPKARFVQSKSRCEAHRAIVGHAQFDQSVDVAMAELTDELLRSLPATVHDGAANAYAISGAQKFVRILKNLSEQVEAPRSAPVSALRHDI